MQQFGQKRVSAGSIQPGDVIFRSTPTGGDLAMEVQRVVLLVKDGATFLTYTGLTHTINRSGVGENMSGDGLAEDAWTIPDTGVVDKKVPIEQADWG
jgi:hypothetical protein